MAGSNSKSKKIDLKGLSPVARAALQGTARAHIQTTNIADKQRKSARRRKRKGGAMHQPGSRWYGLEAYFDPKLIESTPIEGSGFMMGVLEDFVVIEYKRSMTMAALTKIGQLMNDMGIKAMMVPEGVRFMRLRGVVDDEEKELNAIMEEQRASEEDDRLDSSSTH